MKKACKLCKKLVSQDYCPVHPEAKTVEVWKGRIIILDRENSDIAKKMNIEDKGEYAIRL